MFLLTCALFAAPAHALDADDTLLDWRGAHIAERAEWAERIAAGPRDVTSWITGPYLLICLNELATNPALQGMTIQQATAACVEPPQR